MTTEHLTGLVYGAAFGIFVWPRITDLFWRVAKAIWERNYDRAHPPPKPEAAALARTLQPTTSNVVRLDSKRGK